VAAKDRIVCPCLKVTESQIRYAVLFRGVQTISDICDSTDAGNGCMGCHEEIAALLRRYARSATVPVNA